MKMKTVKWLGKEPTLIRQIPLAEKVDLKPNQTIEVEEGIAEELTGAYKKLIYVDKPKKRAKRKVSKKPDVETQNVKAKDVEQG